MIRWRDFKIYNAMFFVIRIFSQFVNSCLFDACFNRTGLWFTACYSFHTCAATADFSISQFFIFLKCSLTLVSKFLFVFSIIYILAIFAIDLINSWFIFWRNVIFEVGIQKIFDGKFVTLETEIDGQLPFFDLKITRNSNSMVYIENQHIQNVT